MTLEIRNLLLSDREVWLPLWAGYLEFYESILVDEVTQYTFARLCDPNETQMGGFIAFDGEDAVGIVHYVIHKTCWSDKDVCYLQDLFVAPNCRKGGVGRTLIEKVHEYACENNLYKTYWQTHNTNETARKLYDKVAQDSGFIVYKMDI